MRLVTNDKPQHPARATYDSNTLAAQDRFLANYGRLGTITTAALASSVAACLPYQWSRDDVQGFKQRLHDAKEAFADYIESIVLKRIESPEGNRGSDTLVMFALNGLRPEKYKPELRQQGNIAPSQTVINIIVPPGAELPQQVVEGESRLVEEPEAG